MSKERLINSSPLSYLGVEPLSPVDFFEEVRLPTVNDYRNYNLGALWLERVDLTAWMLVDKERHVGTWIQFGGPNTIGNGLDGQVLIGGGAAPVWAYLTSPLGTITFAFGSHSVGIDVTAGIGTTQFVTDAGIAAPVAGVIVFAGGTSVGTVAGGNTVTVNLDDNVIIPNTLTVSSLGAGVVQTTAAGLFFSDNGTNGQVLIGGGTEPNWMDITSTGGTVAITSPGVNTLNLEVVGGGSSGVKFLALQFGTVAACMGSATPYVLGTGLNGQFVEIFDEGNDFYPGNGAGMPAQFVAPQTGKYCFLVVLSVDNLGLGGSIPAARIRHGEINVITPSKTYTWLNPYIHKPAGQYPQMDTFGLHYRVMANLTMGDNVTFSAGFWKDPPFPNIYDLEGTLTSIAGYLIL